MIPQQLSPLANHLWQSTLFAALIFLITLALRQHHARIRYRLWLAASIKFLLPLSLLAGLAGQFQSLGVRSAATALPPAIGQIAQPFSPPHSTTPPALPRQSSPSIPALCFAVWLAGSLTIVGRWCVRSRPIWKALRTATQLPIVGPAKVMCSSVRLEPGIFGVFRPVLLLPQGIEDHLKPSAFQSILAHEFCHVRRRDNLAAAFHMVVEAVCWFHPVVWWIGGKLIEERERACDEEVLRLGIEPQDYAEGILDVCRFYLESPLACAAGVTGSDLEKRIEAIMTGRPSLQLTLARKSLLAAAGIALVAGSITLALAQTKDVPALRFEVASIKPAGPSGGRGGFNPLPGGSVRFTGITVQGLVSFAYDMDGGRLSGGPGWTHSDGFDIYAKPERDEGPADFSDRKDADGLTSWERLQMRLRVLLAERFQLVVHKDTKEAPVYILTVARGGAKLQPSTIEGPHRTLRSRDQINGARSTIHHLSAVLSNWLGRPVLDRTGLTGTYDFKVEYAPDPNAPGADPSVRSDGPSIFTALEEQLGLRLQAGRGPMETLVIDRVSRPSEN